MMKLTLHVLREISNLEIVQSHRVAADSGSQALDLESECH